MSTQPRFVALLLACAAGVASCSFNAHPTSGKQACSTDNPPQCPDGYSCVSGYCYDNSATSTGGSGGGEGGQGGACTPTVVCGTGPGKRCGAIADLCGTVECGSCAEGETCGANNVCSVRCGQRGEACCTGSKCAAKGTVCSNGTCTACGEQNQICCANDTCVADATCAEASVKGGAKTCLATCAKTVGTCTSGAEVDCAVHCGPDGIGSRTCTCSSSDWRCSSCTYPEGDYTCYQVPATVGPCDSATLPTVGQACERPACEVCGSSTSRAFYDAAGYPHVGYCICKDEKWACSVTRDWPCPGADGC